MTHTHRKDQNPQKCDRRLAFWATAALVHLNKCLLACHVVPRPKWCRKGAWIWLDLFALLFRAEWCCHSDLTSPRWSWLQICLQAMPSVYSILWQRDKYTSEIACVTCIEAWIKQRLKPHDIAIQKFRTHSLQQYQLPCCGFSCSQRHTSLD